MLGTILVAILAAFGLSIIAAGVKIIGQAEVMVIERLGPLPPRRSIRLEPPHPVRRAATPDRRPLHRGGRVAA